MIQISIVMPVYNAAAYLERSVGCLLEQTYTDFELVAVDDGSEDESLAILQDYADRDVRIHVFHQGNAGASAARNAALDRIQGAYVTFLDADDWLDLDGLETLIRLAERTEADIAQCKICYNDANGAQYIPMDAFPDGTVVDKPCFPQTVYRRMMTGMQMNHLTHTLYRRRLFDDLRLRTDMRTAEDLYCNVDLFTRAQRFAYTNRPCYHYYRHADAITGRGLRIRTRFACNWRVAQKMRSMLGTWGMDRFSIRLQVYSRPALLLFSKLLRMTRNQLMKFHKSAAV